MNSYNTQLLNKYCNFSDIDITKSTVLLTMTAIYVLETVDDSPSRPLDTKMCQFPLHRWQLAPPDPEATR